MKWFRTSTGKLLGGKEVYINDVVYHPKHGAMQVLDIVESKPNCLFLVHYPHIAGSRGFIEPISDLGWEK